MPSGELGSTMKKSVGAELLYMNEFEDSWRLRAGISFIKMTPRLDTFPVYLTATGYDFTVAPGYQVFHRYNWFLFSFGADKTFIENDNYRVYLGADIIAGISDYDTDIRYEGIIDESTSDGQAILGLKPRIGFEYSITESLLVYSEASFGVYKMIGSQLSNYKDFGLGFTYIFD